MEKWDLYDENGNKLNKTIIRGEKLADNEYHKSVHIWIVNDNKEFLIQKRSPNEDRFPNMWSMTGGAVVAGEESDDACIREVSEELGISIERENMKLLGTVKRKNGLVDIWIVNKNLDIKTVVLQEEEVSEVKWASIDEIEELLKKEQFTPSVVPGLEMCIKYL